MSSFRFDLLLSVLGDLLGPDRPGVILLPLLVANAGEELEMRILEDPDAWYGVRSGKRYSESDLGIF